MSLYVHNIHLPGNQNVNHKAIALKSGDITSIQHNLVLAETKPKDRHLREQISERLAKAIKDGEERLEVYFSCFDNCDFEDNYRERKPLILPKEGEIKTTPIEFFFTPKTNETAKIVTYSIVIWRNGIVYDNLRINVCVFNGSFQNHDVQQICGELEGVNRSSQNNKEVKIRQNILYEERVDGGEMADVAFRMEKPKNSSQYFLIAEINDARLLSQLDAANFKTISKLKGANNVWRIPTSYTSQEDLLDDSQYAYAILSCLVIKRNGSPDSDSNKFIEHLGRDFDECGAAPKNSSSTHWGKDRAKYFGKRYLELGNHLRVGLFPGPEGKVFLNKITDRAKRNITNGRTNLSISYNFNSTRLPLQFLHSMESFELDKPDFLGMIAELADYSGTIDSSSRTGIRAQIPSGKHVAFVGYKNLENNSDIIEKISKSQIERTRKVFTGPHKEVSQTLYYRSDIINYLATNRTEIDIIWIYAHGDSRAWSSQNEYDLRSGAQRILTVKEKGGYEVLTAQGLKGLSNSGIDRPLRSGPLVVMLACETNSPSIGATNNRKFNSSLRKLGVGGIISSESEIPANTAEEFGDRLANIIAKGNTVSVPESILSIRRELYFGKNATTDPRDMLDLGAMLVSYTGGHGYQWAIV